MAHKRIGLNEIVRTLNAEQIPTPAQYAVSKGLTGNYDQGNGLWNTRSVKKILTNITYTGVLVQGKNNTLVENTHEPIIPKEVFALMQSLLAGTGAENNSAKPSAKANALKGKVICRICGGKMQRKKGSGGADWHFFTCITKNRMGAERCSGMYIREAEVLTAIRLRSDGESHGSTGEIPFDEQIASHLEKVTISDGKKVLVELI